MALTIRRFPCLTDNYGFLIRDAASGMTAAVDTPDGAAVLRDLEASGWGRLDLILNTHWHPDHTGGNAEVAAATGAALWAPQEVTRVSAVDRVLTEGDVVELGETRFRVVETPGHTLGHVVFLCETEPLAFVGDTLFALGCGRLFEGTPEQMFDSLRRFDPLTDETAVWCAHEYTEANARFLLSVDDRPEAAAHAADIVARRAAGEATVPTTLGVERRFNPFLRAPDAESFARVRAAKDVF